MTTHPAQRRASRLEMIRQHWHTHDGIDLDAHEIEPAVLLRDRRYAASDRSREAADRFIFLEWLRCLNEQKKHVDGKGAGE